MASAVAAVDVGTKWLVERRLDEPVALVAGLRLDLGYNSGIAFGALTGLPPWVLMIGVGGMVIGLVVASWRGGPSLPWASVGLLLGGALGNLVDRIDDGRVTDFIDPPRWPAFNLADTAITGAVLVLLWRASKDERRRAATSGSRIGES